MELLPSELTPVPSPLPRSSARTGLLVCRDLIFITKVKDTAVDLGYSLTVASTESRAKSMIEENRPCVVFIDVTSGEVAAPSAMRAYQELAGVGVWFVAFGPHVEVDILAAAKAAGCHIVMPRSRFAAELPGLIQRFFSQPVPGNERA